MSKEDIKIPNIGEFKDVEVIEILIKKGQEIKKDDPLIMIESDKSSVEIPSTAEGIITSLNIKVGDKVSEGDKILELETNENPNKEKKTKLLDQENSKEIIKKITPKIKNTADHQNLITKDFSTIASASPKVLDTANLPGYTLRGPFAILPSFYFAVF
jgi:pyruvate dehydrogenase E2 component (dihydrolipoamide acetyltransferase)